MAKIIKIVILFSILILGLFLVGCNQEAVAGEAVKVAGKTIALDCKEFGNPSIITTGDAFCKGQGYDACTGGGIWVTASFYKDAELKTFDYSKKVYFMLPCGLDFSGDEQWGIKNLEDYEDLVVKTIVGNNPALNYKSGPSDGVIACCRVRG